jgi:amino acid transporter
MPDLPRRIGFWGASAIMVGIIIGSGIFRTPPEVAKYLSDPWVILAFWGLGGILSLFGALTYAELACMYPQSGGVYVFLREGLGRPVAFVFGWTYMLISKPFAAAGIAVVFGENLNRLLDVHWDTRVTTSLLLIILTTINTFGLGLGAGVAKFLTTTKIAALALIVLLALILDKGSTANFTSSPVERSLLLAIAPVMSAILWTYDGWSDVGAIAGEVKNPQRELPRIYLAGTAAVTLLYLAVNAAYMYLMPLSEMRGTDSVAPIVTGRLIGEVGAAAVVVIILVSTLGSTHGSIITGARVTYAQSRDRLLFSFLSRVHPRFQTPAVALWVQLALSCAALWYAGSFQKLADSFIFTMWIFYGLAAAAIFILRIKRPEAPRPFRCPGYPLIPALFILAAGAMTVLLIIDDVNNPDSKGRMVALWLGVLVLGVPVYYIWKRIFPAAATSNGSEP